MRTFRGMNPWTRTIIGGVGGGLLGGDVIGALTGGLMLRGLVGGNAAAFNAAAGAAGAAAGQSWARRFAWGAFRFLRLSAGLFVLGQVIENWKAFSVRLREIWAGLKKAAPTWLGGAGEGWGAVGTGFAGLGTDMRNSLTARGLMGPEHATPYISTPLNDEFRPRPWWDLGSNPPWEVARDLWNRATGTTAGAQGQAPVTIGTVTNNFTVQVAPTNADPSVIGEAAGNAVGSALRGVLADTPSLAAP